MSGRGRLVPAVAGTIAVLIVVAAVIAGFMVVGSPWEARKEAADARRVEELLQIADNIRAYYRVKGKAPKDLVELVRYFQLYWLSTKDPVTNRPYEYRRLDELRYELCAVFDTDQSQREMTDWEARHLSPARAAIHRHPKGRACFVLDAKRDSEGD